MTHDEAKAEAAKIVEAIEPQQEFNDFKGTSWIEFDKDGAINRIAAALVAARPQWRDIETAPKDSSWFLGLMRTRRQAVVRWGGGTWEDDNRLCRDPIAWMPLPAPPVEALLPVPESMENQK